MKAYKLELLVIDFDEIGPEEMKIVLENARYPNRCISPTVMNTEVRDLGEWDDDHLLNYTDERRENEYNRLFHDGKIEITEADDALFDRLVEMLLKEDQRYFPEEADVDGDKVLQAIIDDRDKAYEQLNILLKEDTKDAN